MIRIAAPPRLGAVRPNVGIERKYRRSLLILVDKMHRSVVRWVSAAWREETPESVALMAADVAPDRLARTIAKMVDRWQADFDQAAFNMAEHFATSAETRVANALRAIFRRAGLTVSFRLTPAMRDVLAATIHENVGLIRSVPARYLREVEGIVMRSAQTGRDLESATKALRRQFNVTKKRAALIARDQNNKATSAMFHAREAELGIKENIWRHSGAGKHPRPDHVKAGRDGLRYDPRKGAYISGQWIFPGQLINCRCVGIPVIEGFTP